MLTYLLAISSFGVGSAQPDDLYLIAVRLDVLSGTLKNVYTAADDIQRLRFIAKQSPHLAMRCEDLIQQTTKLQQSFALSCGSQLYGLLNDIGLRVWPYNAWEYVRTASR